MGIELPPELADVAAQAGVAWPEADEDAMTKAAQAWRDAATGMTTLTTDADNTVRTALNAVQGDTGNAAAQHWSAFVEPDSGHLTSTVRGMSDAADRLDHAAQQVGTAKVEIVRNLVSLAQNSDAAHSAAAAGHPMALTGLDTAVRGTSANVANIESNLISAVQPGSGVDMAAVQAPVNASPGAHGPTLLDTVGAVAETATGGDGNVVADTVRGAANLVADPTAAVTDTAHRTTSTVDDTLNRTTAVVDDTGRGATGVVDDVVGGGPAAGGSGQSGPGQGGPGHGGANLVGDTIGGAHGVVDGTVGQLPGVAPGPGDPDVTGPVPIGPDILPGDHRPGNVGDSSPGLPGDGRPGYWGPDDRPTPPTGTTVQAGFDSAPAAPANLPPGAPPIAGVPAPGAPGGAPGIGGGPNVGGGPNFGGGPGFTGGGAAGAAPAPGAGPAAPGAGAGAAAGAAGARPAERQVMRPLDPAPPVESRTKGGAPAQPGAGQPAPGKGVSQPGGPGNVAHPGGGQAGLGQPVPGAAKAGTGQPGGQAPLGQPSQVASSQQAPAQPVPDHSGQPVARERDEVLALFWVHMFPIGHMPVAADRPARQVPAPREELDYAAGIRFEPGDHPRADLVDSADRRAALRDGAPLVAPSEPLTRDDVATLAEGHDPLGGENERDWDRRYQVRFGRVTAEGIRPDGLEFAWPPGEQYPEGGSAEGEAEVLDAGAELDRFGPAGGRVFAEAGTSFARRSLPPAHLDHGYRRYRVLRPLPVWRAVSAAWFAQPGGGVRYRTTHSAIELVALGYLADITREEP